MRVVVADDVLLTREGIVRLLRDAGIEVVAEAEDAQGLLHHVRVARPDVALVDIRMPPTQTDEGIRAAQEIRRAHPEIGVIVLSHHLESRYAMRLLEEHPGGAGYLLKQRVSNLGVLTDALGRLRDGECVVDPTIVARLVKRVRPARQLAELTEREREVIEMRFGLNAAEPRTLEEVGHAFGVTRERIRQIENNALKKLKSLPEAQRLRSSGG